MASLLAIEIPYLRRVMFAAYCFNLKLDHSDHDILVGVLDSSTGKPGLTAEQALTGKFRMLRKLTLEGAGKCFKSMTERWLNINNHIHAITHSNIHAFAHPARIGALT
eukprot:GHVU01189025.1.p1 GENE.GHVU01189025.1~~GHVU01189025.1.p1  ORF type:complete len:108 (+),score=10.83 GHVU01189025.1:245-568(+)